MLLRLSSTPLTVRGQVSQLEALRVGAFIEEVDMRDVQAAIDNSGHADITQTYENLLRGSPITCVLLCAQ